MKIIGAGLAGLLAANVFQRAKVFEAGSEDQVNHKAVLRFRTDAVGAACGIEFRKVRVHKGLWMNGSFRSPSIQLANLYSQKVVGRLADRSVWHLDPVDRFIAPEDLVAQMAERCGNRIEWGCQVEEVGNEKEPTISTIPMNVLARMLRCESPPEFSYEPIKVRRWHIPGADVFQTVYFPDPETNLYRASITGSLLIAEYMDEADNYDLFSPFGLTQAQCVELDSVKQRYGKIAPIDERWRRNFILNASVQHNIYSVGRFATWRNLILDSVLHDIHVVKKLVAGDRYSQYKHGHAK